MRRLHRLGGLLAAVLVTAATALAVPAAPAQAASCAGVGVVVDFGALGGGTSTGCGSGATADRAFSSAGYALRQHPRQPGFVCQVQGKPADGDCLATDAYWGFFVSDEGKGWVYSSQGVYQTAVDAGDSVALVWQSSASRRTPAAAPLTPATTGGGTGGTSTGGSTPSARPEPRPKATRHVDRPADPAASASPRGSAAASAGASAGTTAAAPQGSATTAGASPRAQRPHGTRRPDVSASPSPSAGATASAETTEPTGSASTDVTTAATEPAAADTDGGLPGWVPPVLVAVLVAAAGATAWARRAR